MHAAAMRLLCLAALLSLMAGCEPKKPPSTPPLPSTGAPASAPAR